MAEHTRTTKVWAAPSIGGEAVPAHLQGEVVESVPKTGTKGPRFVSEHTLFIRVDQLKDLPSGTIYIRKDEYRFAIVETGKIPMEKQGDLHAAIEAGKVYAVHDLRSLQFEELDPWWPQNTHKRIWRANLRAQRKAVPKTGTNNENDGYAG